MQPPIIIIIIIINTSVIEIIFISTQLIKSLKFYPLRCLSRFIMLAHLVDITALYNVSKFSFMSHFDNYFVIIYLLFCKLLSMVDPNLEIQVINTFASQTTSNSYFKIVHSSMGMREGKIKIKINFNHKTRYYYHPRISIRSQFETIIGKITIFWCALGQMIRMMMMMVNGNGKRTKNWQSRRMFLFMDFRLFVCIVQCGISRRRRRKNK